MSEKQGSVLGLGHGDNQAVAGTTVLLYAISHSQLVKFQRLYSLNTSKCVSWDIFNSSRNVLKGTGCKAGHLRSCPQELHPPAPHQSGLYVRKRWIWGWEYTAHVSQVPSLDGSLRSLWHASAAPQLPCGHWPLTLLPSGPIGPNRWIHTLQGSEDLWYTEHLFTEGFPPPIFTRSLLVWADWV